MVSGRAGAAQLGPVRSGRVLGKGPRKGRSLGVGAAGRGEGWGSGLGILAATGVARRGSCRRVLGAQVTGN